MQCSWCAFAHKSSRFLHVCVSEIYFCFIHLSALVTIPHCQAHFPPQFLCHSGFTHRSRPALLGTHPCVLSLRAFGLSLECSSFVRLRVMVSLHSSPFSSKVTPSKGPSLTTQSKTDPTTASTSFYFLIVYFIMQNQLVCVYLVLVLPLNVCTER